MNLLFKLCSTAGNLVFLLLKMLRLKFLFINFCVYLFIKDEFLERVHLIEGNHHALRSEEWYQPQAPVVSVPIPPFFSPPASPSTGKSWRPSRL